jgi:hypothetical protein
MRSGSEFGQADSPIGWVRNTPQQPPWLWWSRSCLLWDGAKIRRKTVALIRDFCENQAAGDAAADEADWREVARIVLHIDPEKEPERAHKAWETHLARARWMTTSGYRYPLQGGAPH